MFKQIQPESQADFFAAPEKGIRSHCAACALSVHVVKAPKPLVCPFCRSRMVDGAFELPAPAVIGDDSAEEVRRRQFARRPSRLSVLGLGITGILLLSLAIYFQLTNIEHYWYAPLVNLYSLVVGFFIITRFFLSAFYSAPPDVGYEPMVTVVVPCRNERDSIAKTIARIYREGYPHAKLEVIVVNDASTDDTLTEMLKAQARYPSMVIVDFEKNRGLSHGMAVSALLARGEILVYVDSDTFLLPGAVRKVVQGMADPRVGGVAGHTDVENYSVNLLTKMQDVRYYVSYKVMKAAESLFGAVSCLPGCFSAYRKSCVLHVLDKWVNEKFMGRYGDFGDDRSLTNFILRDYRLVYDDEALATTIAPEHWGKYIRQQVRWTRSWVREIFVASLFMWRKHPAAAIAWYAMMLLPVIEPIVMVQALVVGPIMYGQMTSFYIFGILAITLVWSLYFYEKTGRRHWWTGIIFTFTYALFFSWQVYYALATMRRTKWGTR